MKLLRSRKFLVALAAILSLILVDVTGLDRGLIDNLLNAIVDGIVQPEAVQEVAPVDQSAQGALPSVQSGEAGDS